MSLKYERRLLEHIAHERYMPSSVRELARDLGVEDADQEEFELALDQLVEGKRLARDNAGRVMLPVMPEVITGVFKKNPRGFGFVKPDGKFREGDVFIPPDAVGDALSGDTVKVRTSKYRRDGEMKVSGEIVGVTQRRRACFTGELVKRGSLWIVLPDGRELTQPVTVDDPTVKNAKEGDKVAIEITSYPVANELATGVIVRVLGEAGLPDVETQAVIAAYGLPGEFPKACVDQARAAAQKFEQEVRDRSERGWDETERYDLRETFIITIDPNDSKDYDDAISIEITPDGWNLGVHIADVSHFIPPGTALDVEARERSNSCYLPRHVIPMLPEVLSNGICSLSEGQVRFCKSAFMSYTTDGDIVSESVGATVIKSTKRLTYLEAQALIDGDLREARKHAKTEPKYTEQLIKSLREMDKCAKAILSRRRREGMIHLELPEVELIFDDAGHVVDAVPEDNAFTHRLIEMFMVEANEVLARLFAGMDIPLLRRIHPEPPPGDVSDLRQTAKVAGFNIPKEPTRQELQKLLDSTAGTPAARAVHFAVLRTLTRAEYSPALVGHFALASEAYAHFTSPIRRYADLTVHRALSAYLHQTDNETRRPRNDRERGHLGRVLMDLGPSRGVLDQDELVDIGRHATRQEENAESAEHDLRSFLVLQLLSSRVGETFAGIVTNVSGAGVFVQLEKYLVDGLIKTDDLPGGQGFRGGRWTVDQRTGALVNQATGRSFKTGDRVQVTIGAIDLALRRMDLVITDPSSRDAGKSQRVSVPGGGAGARKKPDEKRGNAGYDEFFHRNRLSGSKRRAMRSKDHDQKKPGHAGGAGPSGPVGGAAGGKRKTKKNRKGRG